MGFTLGIVGLPNVGKSTLFNVLSKAKANVSNYPFTTINPNVGVVEVPDERLLIIQKIMGSPKAIPTTIEFIDIAGLVKGASRGEGLGNQFLSHIREVDAIAHVVRCFADTNITHVEGPVDPKRDIELINIELELGEIKKPVLYVANVDESGNLDQVEIIEKIAKQEGAKVVSICAKLEAEISELSPEEGREYLKVAGIKEFALQRLIKTGYELLNLVAFFTANNKEAHAWTVKQGTLAPQAAGKVHTDMEKGFIAAEVINFPELDKAGSLAAAREKGLIRTEGREYLVKDGDLVLVRFNV